MDVAAFYGVLAGLSFTRLGLWWVACQSRMAWIRDRVGRGMAYVVSLHFALPGAMSLLSLVAPDIPVLWRVTFATAGAAGLITALERGHRSGNRRGARVSFLRSSRMRPAWRVLLFVGLVASFGASGNRKGAHPHGRGAAEIHG